VPDARRRPAPAFGSKRASPEPRLSVSLRTSCERLAGRLADACSCGGARAALSSGSALELVAARSDALEVGSGTTGAAREATVDRLPGDRTSGEHFGRHMRLPNVHHAISLRQSPDHGSLDHTVAKPFRLGQDGCRHASAGGRALENRPQDSLKRFSRV